MTREKQPVCVCVHESGGLKQHANLLLALSFWRSL
jgi:hypothetical protein